MLAGNLLFFIEYAVGPAQVDADVIADVALYNTGYDVFLLLAVVLIDDAALFLADLLHDHVLGDLSGDAAEISAVDINTDNVAYLGVTVDLDSILESDLLQVVHDIIGSLNNSLLCIAGIIKGIAVYFRHNVFDVFDIVSAFAEMALAGCNESVFNRLGEGLCLDVLLLCQLLDSLFQLFAHVVSFIYSKSNASRMEAISFRIIVSFCLPDWSAVSSTGD